MSLASAGAGGQQAAFRDLGLFFDLGAIAVVAVLAYTGCAGSARDSETSDHRWDPVLSAASFEF